MFYVDGDRLLAIHFYDGGNRSRMEGKISPDGNTLEFNTLDVAGGHAERIHEAYGVHHN